MADWLTELMGSANDGNAGEANAVSYALSLAAETSPVLTGQTSTTLTGFGGAGTDPSVMSYGGSSDSAGSDNSFFSNLLSKGGDLVSEAWNKDPLALLKLGAGAIGGMYAEDQKRKAAEAAIQGQMDVQNNADALKQAEISRYNKSFNTTNGYKKPTTKQLLRRLNGTPIYNNTGNIQG
jgi:hypothetical protein